VPVVPEFGPNVTVRSRTFEQGHRAFDSHIAITTRIRSQLPGPPSAVAITALSKPVHEQLDDLRLLANDLRYPPTRWGEIVDTDPEFIGAVDAAAAGMGGVWFDPKHQHPPMLWRQAFPEPGQREVVSWGNPHGKLTKSDLEQAGVITHATSLRNVMISTNVPWIRCLTTNLLSPDTVKALPPPTARPPTSVGSTNVSTTTASNVGYIPRILNVMADILSRRWDPSDSQLLALFESRFQQKKPMVSLPPTMRDALKHKLRLAARCG